MGQRLETLRKESHKRLIGHFGGKTKGVCVVVVAGMHGNEPSGVVALRQLFNELNESNVDFLGEVYGIAGNLAALDKKVRFLDQDLNRMWKLEENFQDLKPLPISREVSEREDIHRFVSSIIEEEDRPLVFLDLHTTSAESPPFLIIGDTLANRTFVEGLFAPVILGLEEQLDGPLLSYINTLGHISMGYEAGQHDAPEAIQNHLSMLYLVLNRAGCLVEDLLIEKHRNRLKSQVPEVLQKFFEVKVRHGVTEEDKFKMLPGFYNFQKIKKGIQLAGDHTGVISSTHKGRIFMPLYQDQGDDGFFIVRSVPSWALRFSAWLRRIGTDKILSWMPGVKKDPYNDNILHLNPKVVLFFGPQVFHLLGFRKIIRKEDRFWFIKRHT